MDHSDASRCYARGHYFRHECCFYYDHELNMEEKPCRCVGHSASYASIADSGTDSTTPMTRKSHIYIQGMASAGTYSI
jgi:hypothetical protein